MSDRVTARLRFEILTRDGYRCAYCGAAPDEKELHVDHVVPVALGGRAIPENLVTACRDCNAGKASVMPGSELVVAVERDSIRWARAIKRAMEARQLERERIAAIIGALDVEWKSWTYDGKRRRPVPRPDDWDLSVERFVTLGLDLQALSYYLTLSMRKEKIAPEKTWAYFCGCCWNGLQDVQSDAKKLLEEDE